MLNKENSIILGKKFITDLRLCEIIELFCKGFSQFLKTGDVSKINEDILKGIPIRKPFESLVYFWIKKYGSAWQLKK